MTLMTISTAKKAGTTIGGANHDADAAELLSLTMLGEGLEAPPSSSQRAIAAAWPLASVGAFSLGWVMFFTWVVWPPMAGTYHEHVREQDWM